MKLTSTLKLETYNCRLVFILTDQLIKHVNDIYKKHKLPDTFDIEAEGVMLSPDMYTYYCLIDTECLTHNTIAHESHHSVFRILQDRDIDDEETGAWLAGHVAEFIYKFLDKKKITIQHG